MVAKLPFIFLAIAGFFGLQMNNVYVPEGFERPFYYKAMISGFKLVGVAARTAEQYGYGTEVSNFRSGINFASVVPENDNIKIEYKVLSNVPVRVYSPKTTSQHTRPIMIFYHGGGYAIGSLTSYELFLFKFVEELDMVVVSVDYRMGPEHPYPIPTSDCYTATRYIIDHPTEFNADLSRLVMAGDSAGGNAVAVLTQRLLTEKRHLPKIQLLIYPWCQLFHHRFPSALRYTKASISDVISIARLASWYIGVKVNVAEVEALLESNNHTALVSDPGLRSKLNSYMDVSQIPEKYRVGHAYYSHNEAVKSPFKDPQVIEETNLFKRDTQLTNLLSQLHHPSFSPLFADHDKLVGLPKTYILVLEWDNLKDENLLYAERLKKAGVEVNVAFWERAFHGIMGFTHETFGYNIAREIEADMIRYLRQHLL